MVYTTRNQVITKNRFDIVYVAPIERFVIISGICIKNFPLRAHFDGLEQDCGNSNVSSNNKEQH